MFVHSALPLVTGEAPDDGHGQWRVQISVGQLPEEGDAEPIRGPAGIAPPLLQLARRVSLNRHRETLFSHETERTREAVPDLIGEPAAVQEHYIELERVIPARARWRPRNCAASIRVLMGMSDLRQSIQRAYEDGGRSAAKQTFLDRVVEQDWSLDELRQAVLLLRSLPNGA
jgi:hypothetical protein